MMFEKIFFNFWRNICECRLLPLTIDYQPTQGEVSNREVYYMNENKILEKPQNEVTFVKTDGNFIEELVCLRLT
jgi:hypothetical protein